MKNRKFTFNYTLRHKVVRDLKIVTETVGSLDCECIGCIDANASKLEPFDRYHVEFETIKWQGVDVLPLLEVTGIVEDVQIECVRYFATIAEDE